MNRNEISFRKYLKRYHPDKYDELILKESIQEKKVTVYFDGDTGKHYTLKNGKKQFVKLEEI